MDLTLFPYYFEEWILWHYVSVMQNSFKVDILILCSSITVQELYSKCSLIHGRWCDNAQDKNNCYCVFCFEILVKRCDYHKLLLRVPLSSIYNMCELSIRREGKTYGTDAGTEG